MKYKEFINNIINTRGRFNCEGYHERHHILPECLNGTDDDNNLIDLYPQEHYEAHKLLSQENPTNDKLVYAWWMMSNRFTQSADEYAIARKAYSKVLSKREHIAWNKGLTKETDNRVATPKTAFKNGDKPWNMGLPKEKQPRYGAKWTEEQHIKYANSGAGEKIKQKWNDPDYRERILSKNRRAVRCIELNMVFKSIDEATKYFNKSCLHMAEVIRNNRLCCGYHWEYVKEA